MGVSADVPPLHSWEEFQKIIEEYDMVLVMAYLVGPQSSTDALKIYEE